VDVWYLPSLGLEQPSGEDRLVCLHLARAQLSLWAACRERDCWTHASPIRAMVVERGGWPYLTSRAICRVVKESVMDGMGLKGNMTYQGRE
jgi:hypothetical protein